MIPGGKIGYQTQVLGIEGLQDFKEGLGGRRGVQFHGQLHLVDLVLLTAPVSVEYSFSVYWLKLSSSIPRDSIRT